jgi:dihydropteroate synthase
MMSSSQKLHDLCKKNKPVWMGILNVTPDSFSDGGLFNSVSHATKRAQELWSAGAHILDVGGVSTRPGSHAISANDEMARVVPVAQSIRQHIPQAILSIDTFRPCVARKLAQEGLIDLINDVAAGNWRDEHSSDTTLHVAKDFDLGITLMHMQGQPQTMQENPHYENCILEVSTFLRERAELAQSLGIRFVSIDPGIGFGKRFQDNLDLLSEAGIKACAALGFPLLIGLSRKRFLGELYKNDTLDMSVPRNRDARSKDLELRVLQWGAAIIRTHTMPQELSS